jgi:ABC-type branched-subunit amino acid transport system permease subunit
MMVLLGGMSTFFGPIVGAATFIALTNDRDVACRALFRPVDV